MPLSAKKFIQNRKNVVAITNDRIGHIMWYTIECYNLLVKDKPSYSKTHVATNTAYHFEDYLKMEFVEKYLIRNKSLLAGKLAALEEVTFTFETIQRFTDMDGIERSDKIDVYVNKLGLKDEWAVQEEHLYLAIECKRINILSDCNDYIEDIQKFCDRNHSQLRIPFEGQIAFIENSELNHNSVATEINNKLKNAGTIITKDPLKQVLFHSLFKGSYSSRHKKNFKKKEPFTIFHLLFDYSTLVKA